MLSRICAQSGSSLGSNSTHCVPRFETFLDVQSHPPHRYVLIRRARHRRRARYALPTPPAAAGIVRRQLSPSGLSSPFSGSVIGTQARYTHQRRVYARRRFPHTSLGVGAGQYSGHRTARHKSFYLASTLGFG